MYSIQQALVSERVHHRHSVATNRRLANELSAVRRWAWLAAYSARKQSRLQQMVETQPAGSYELAG